MRLRCLFPALVAILAPAAMTASAVEPVIPRFWDTREQLPKPDISDLPRLRFLTSPDFPPFNFLDEAGRLSGFHVDLARAICSELDLLERCEIQALPFAELDKALFSGDGEAILAGVAITAENRRRYAFSRAYLQFPARFATRDDAAFAKSFIDQPRGRRVGVIAGSAHEAVLRAYFPDLQPVTYARSDWMLGDLKDDKTDAVFGDGMRLSFWLGGADAAGCCRFAGGPYLAPEMLGRGLAIATRPEDAELAAAFDYALREVHAKSIFAELYLRYFPIGFF